jgi:hypothetical protein
MGRHASCLKTEKYAWDSRNRRAEGEWIKRAETDGLAAGGYPEIDIRYRRLNWKRNQEDKLAVCIAARGGVLC